MCDVCIYYKYLCRLQALNTTPKENAQYVQMDGWMNIDRQTDAHLDRWSEKQVDSYLYGLINGEMMVK